MLRNINAFTLGARSVDPKITTQLIVTGDWSLPVKEAEAANSMIDQGVDVVTCHVDSPKVIVETAERRGIFVCGYHANQATLAPKGYLTGAEWYWITPYTTHVKDAMAGKPMVNFLRGGLKDGFVKTSPYGPAVSEGARKNADGIKAQMMKGDFVIFKGPLQGQRRQDRHRHRRDPEADRRGARADELSGRGRHRESLTRKRSDRGKACAAPPSMRRAAEAIAIPVAALLAAMVLFGLFMAALGHDPLEVYALIYRGGFASAFSWQNTLARAAPLILTALCVALPAQAGLMIIGGEGALVLGGLAAAVAGHLLVGAPPARRQAGHGPRRHARGGRVDRAGRRAAPVSRRQRDHLQPAPHLHRHRALQPRRRGSPARSGEPQQTLDRADRRGQHAGEPPRPRRALGPRIRHRLLPRHLRARAAHHAGLCRCASWAATRARRGWPGCPWAALMLGACALGGAAAGLAGMVEVAAVHGSANASLVAGYGYAGILVAFIARQNPLAIVPVAVLVGGIAASGGMLQRRLDLPDATVLVLQGVAFMLILASETLYGRVKIFRAQGEPQGGAGEGRAAGRTGAGPRRPRRSHRERCRAVRGECQNRGPDRWMDSAGGACRSP